MYKQKPLQQTDERQNHQLCVTLTIQEHLALCDQSIQ